MEQEGTVSWETPGAGQVCVTWYKIFGDVRKSDCLPLVILHGGPGGAHEYLLNFTSLTEKYGIPVIFYDQVGCGRSSHLKHIKGDEAFWTIDLFRKELGIVVDHLNLREKGFDLVGQSWGAILAASYATDAPSGLRRLVLSSGLADSKDWHTTALKLRRELPGNLRDTLNKGEADGTTDSKEYQEALTDFYCRHLCKVRPFPHPDLAIALEHMANDSDVYNTMWGPSEVELVGSLRSFSIKDRLPDISVPVLLLNGEDDECHYEIQLSFFRAIPNVKWFTFSGASHAIHLEQPERYFRVIAGFLNGNER